MFRLVRFAAARHEPARGCRPTRLRSEALEARQLLSADGMFDEWSGIVGQALPLGDPFAASGTSIEMGLLKGSFVDSALGVIGYVASDAAGNYVMLTSGRPPGAAEDALRQLYVQRFDRGGQALGEAIVIGEQEPLAAQSYRVAMHADGSFLVAWTIGSATSGPGSQSRLRVQRFDSAGQALGSRYETSLAGSTAVVALDVTATGGFVVGYRNRPQATSIVGNSFVMPTPTLHLQRFDAAGQALGPAIDLGEGSDFEMAASGGQIVTLVADAAAGGKYFVQRYGYDGARLGERERLTLLGGPQLNASLDMDDSGRFVIAWQQGVGTQRQVLAQRFGSGGQPLGPAIEVAAGDALREIAAPLVAVTGDGRFFIGWAGDHPPNRGWVTIYSRIPDTLKVQAFDATGQALGDVIDAGLHEGTGMAQISAGGSTLAVTDYFPSLLGSEAASDTFDVPPPLVLDLNGDPPGVDYKLNFVPGGPAVPLVDTARATILGSDQILAATVIIAGYQPGDTLTAASLAGTNIQASYLGGVMTLTGLDSAANYVAAIRGLQFNTTAARAAGETVEIGIIVGNGTLQSAPALSKISIHVPGRASIAGRHVFYNNSSFDGNDNAAGASDDAAIATDKQVLPLDQAASAASVSSYTRGINGILIDLAGQHGTISADDFIFRMGVGNDPGSWTYAPAPLEIVVRAGAGFGGGDRVHIVWADDAIKNAWLQVIVLDNGDTGLAAPDVFFFGNQVGDVGNDTGAARVNATDALTVINRLIDPQNSREATISDRLDFNRDGRITAVDALIVINRLIQNDRVPLEWIEVASEDSLGGAIIVGAMMSIPQPAFVEAVLIQSPDGRPTAEPLAVALQDWDAEMESIQRYVPETDLQLMLEPDDLRVG